MTKFIRTFFITGQSLYGTKLIRDKVYTGTKFIRGQSLYNFFHTVPGTRIKRLMIKCQKYVYHSIKSYMLVLVNYHMDTLSGIGYRSEHIHGGYSMYTGGYLYGEREGYIHYLGYTVCMHGVVTTCLFADVQSSMIFT